MSFFGWTFYLFRLFHAEAVHAQPSYSGKKSKKLQFHRSLHFLLYCPNRVFLKQISLWYNEVIMQPQLLHGFSLNYISLNFYPLCAASKNLVYVSCLQIIFHILWKKVLDSYDFWKPQTIVSWNPAKWRIFLKKRLTLSHRIIFRPNHTHTFNIHSHIIEILFFIKPKCNCNLVWWKKNWHLQ